MPLRTRKSNNKDVRGLKDDKDKESGFYKWEKVTEDVNNQKNNSCTPTTNKGSYISRPKTIKQSKNSKFQYNYFFLI